MNRKNRLNFKYEFLYLGLSGILLLVLCFSLALAARRRPESRRRAHYNENYYNQPRDEWPQRPTPPNPYILYGPHGYKTYPHSQCQEVPTERDVRLSDIEGDWHLIEYMASFDGKPFPPHTPYLCPESKVVFTPSRSGNKMNVSQVAYEWPNVFKDVVEWRQDEDKSAVFYHEENIFALWTMKLMEVKPDDHLLIFFCIDYTIWPGWNHRGVFILSRRAEMRTKIRRRLSPQAHRRMRIDYHRLVNTTVCNPDEVFDDEATKERWHPHRRFNPESVYAPIHPHVSRGHRRNIDALE